MSLVIGSEQVPLTIDADGAVRITGTRVSLDAVVTAFLDGAAAEEIVQRYPTLELGDVYSVIGYYLRRKVEVDSYLSERSQAHEKVRAENERRSVPDGIRERLLKRSRRAP